MYAYVLRRPIGPDDLQRIDHCVKTRRFEGAGWAVYFLHYDFLRRIMAKDSFFIRGSSTAPGGSFVETPIDIGHVVDALGKTVMRIHNISVQTYEVLGSDWTVSTGNSTSNISWQLTTQSKAGTGLVDATDRSVVASGRLDLANAQATGNLWTSISQHADIMPQHWTNGYLVGVDQLYLLVSVDNQLSTGTAVLVMECTSETLTQSAAMSLALSQQ
jgi:hypothetical protein